MSYELAKPYTEDQRLNFVIDHNSLKLEDTERYLFALEANEIMGEKEIEIEVVDYDEEGNPIGSHTETISIPYPIVDPDYEEKQAQKREAEFNKSFFNTSLGYIRRNVTMADGSRKDFLSDLLPVISMGVQGGLTVNILAYDKPSFDEDVTDWTQYQHQVAVTPQFIQECFLQLSADFAPINKE